MPLFARAFVFFFFSTFFLISSAPAVETPPPQPQKKLLRVLIDEDLTKVRVSVKGAYRVKLLPSLLPAKQGRALVNVQVLVTPQGVSLGNESWPGARGVHIEPLEERDLYINDGRFRGSADIVAQKNGLLCVINRLDLEGYLYGVLHHEVSAWWPMEALKAQAIAARTYALYQRSVSVPNAYDVKSTTSSQVYGGSATERNRTKAAVDQTAGEVLTYEGKVFPAYFHATCAGLTAAASELWKIDLPPIRGGVHCGFCRLSPHYGWEAQVPLSVIEEKMAKNNRASGQIIRIEMISQTPSHRVGRVRITGTQGGIEIAAKDLRVWLGGDKLRSTHFTVVVRDDIAVFKGKGWGHGVGLCQWGTLGQSLLGRSHKDILRFYYPKSEILNYKKVKVD